MDVGGLASLAFRFSLVALDAPFATRETAGLCSLLRHDEMRSKKDNNDTQGSTVGYIQVMTVDSRDTLLGVIVTDQSALDPHICYRV